MRYVRHYLSQPPKAVKASLKESWANNPTAKGFTQALERQGYCLAKGDRRGYVAVDWQGEVYSLTHWLNVKTNDLKTKLGERDQLPSVKDTTQCINAKLTDSVQKHLAALQQQYQPRIDRLTQERKRLAKQHQVERAQQKQRQQQRWEQDSQRRQERFAKGMKGLWHRFTGKHGDTIQRNEQDALAAIQRDQKERDELIFTQVKERQAVQREIPQIDQQQQADTQQFKEQLYRQLNETQQHSVKDAFDQVDQRHQERQQHPIGVPMDLVGKAIIRLLKLHRYLCKTITFDNGGEFVGHKKISQQLGCRCYFAKPYHSWQRGLNENTNGLLRRYLPKGSPIGNLTNKALKRLEFKINSRPRKVLNYWSSYELLAKKRVSLIVGI